MSEQPKNSPEELTDLVKRNGGQLKRIAIPAIGAAALAAFFVARATRRKSAKK